MATLHELITKVIPLKGILRTPSYWMRRVLTAIADAVEAVRAELVSTSDKLALKDELLTKAVFYAKSGQPFFILDKGTKMIIDGNTVQAEPYKVYKAKSLRFRNDDFSASKVDFLISLNIPAISFIYCTTLTSLDVSNFDTSAVTNMYSMFQNCSSLASLDLSNFDISKVTSKNNMFYNCTALRNIKCKQAFKDWCVANASNMGLTVENITWEIVQ